MTTAEQPSDTTAPAAEPDPCEYLPWDSRFFGFETGRVLGDTLTADRVRQIDRWCGRRKVVCLYFLSRGDDAQTRALLSQRFNGASPRSATVATGSAPALVSPAPRPPNPVRTSPQHASDEPPGRPRLPLASAELIADQASPSPPATGPDSSTGHRPVAS